MLRSEKPDMACKELYKGCFLRLPTDKELLADFVNACLQKQTAAIETKRIYIMALVYLSKFRHSKSRLLIYLTTILSILSIRVIWNRIYIQINPQSQHKT